MTASPRKIPSSNPERKAIAAVVMMAQLHRNGGNKARTALLQRGGDEAEQALVLCSATGMQI